MKKETESYKGIEKEMISAEKIENEMYNKSKFKTSKEDLISFSNKISEDIKDNKYKTRISTRIAHLCSVYGFIIKDNILCVSDNSFNFSVFHITKNENKIVKYLFSYGNTNLTDIHILCPDGSYITEYEKISINENNIKTIYKEYNIFDENNVQVSKEVFETYIEYEKEKSTEIITKQLFIRKDNQIYKMENKTLFKDKIKEELQRCDYEEQERYFISNIIDKNKITTREPYKEIPLEEYKEVLNSDNIGKVKLRQKY